MSEKTFMVIILIAMFMIGYGIGGVIVLIKNKTPEPPQCEQCEVCGECHYEDNFKVGYEECMNFLVPELMECRKELLK